MTNTITIRRNTERGDYTITDSETGGYIIHRRCTELLDVFKQLQDLFDEKVECERCTFPI